MKMKRRLFCAASVLALLCALPSQAVASQPKSSALPEVVDAPLLFEAPVPAAPAVEEDWFSDAVFLGDPRLYAMAGGAEVPGLALSFSDINVQTARTKNSYTDRNFTLAQALEGGAWTKVYVMLGLNEAAWMDEATFCSEYAALIDDLRALLPQAKIYIQTLIPVTSFRSAAQSPSNTLLARRNYLLAQLAREKQVYLVDTAAPFTQPGGLADALSTDGLYLTPEGCYAWLCYLRTHTVGT